ncbi:MAG: alpha/beta hydrolase [Elusimicrobia bacterium]|nr:alpha/beta hydrolase [Elusimicrobiota bacterium]
MASQPESVWTTRPPRLHLRLWSQDRGRLPVLLVHGRGGNTHWWDKVCPGLGPLAIAALDFHGHGESDWLDEGHYDEALFVRNIEAAREFLNWPRFILAGHSMGARIALEYASLHPASLEALIAVDFLPEFSDLSKERFEKRRRRLRQPYYSDPDAMAARFALYPSATTLSTQELKELGRLCLKETAQGITWKFDWQLFNFRYTPIWKALKSITVPTLLVRGQNSTVMSREDLEQARKALSRCETAEIASAFHHVPLDAPRALSEAMLGFLERNLPALTGKGK